VQVKIRVESAWPQRLKLKWLFKVQSFTFDFNLRPYKLGDWMFGGGYTGYGRNKKLEVTRSVYTFCKRPRKSGEAEKWTTFAMEVGRNIERNFQTKNVRIYFGGDFLFDEQINEAAVGRCRLTL